MKQLVLAALLCCGLCAFGQSSDTAAQPSSSGQTASSSSTTVDGCLSGSAGSYTLTDKASGMTYNLSGDTSKLSAHVGHEVKVTGTKAAADSTPSSASSSAASGAAPAGGQTLTVTSFKHVAASCTASK